MILLWYESRQRCVWSLNHDETLVGSGGGAHFKIRFSPIVSSSMKRIHVSNKGGDNIRPEIIFQVSWFRIQKVACFSVTCS